jgi:hypothetical protein
MHVHGEFLFVDADSVAFGPARFLARLDPLLQINQFFKDSLLKRDDLFCFFFVMLLFVVHLVLLSELAFLKL